MMDKTGSMMKPFMAAFLQGLAVVVLLYGGLAAWAWMQAGQDVVVNADHSGDHGQETTHAAGDHHAQGHSEAQPEISLPRAPIGGLYERAPEGRLPIIRQTDEMTSFRAYRARFDRGSVQGKPVISIVITGLGLSEVATESAIRSMPPEVSLTLSPHTGKADFWVNEARAHGHEIWLSLPLEPPGYPLNDPGPDTLLVNAAEVENARRLNRLMARFTGYVGVLADAAPAFLGSKTDMMRLSDTLKDRGLGFSWPVARDLPRKLTGVETLPHVSIDLILDETTERAEIETMFKTLEDIAAARGHAAGMIRPYPVSYHTLLAWIETLEEKGFVLAPLSVMADL